VTATNVNGTGPASSASNSVIPPVTDGDGNVYNTITIGTHVWMKENLKTTRYRNGDLIGTTISPALDISTLVNPKYQWPSADSVYGRLYTWYSVNDNRNVCPLGWHVPSSLEWTTLTDFLGGDTVAGYKMKESGDIHWWTRECLCKQATNESGFTGLPAGCRYANGNLTEIGEWGYWWSSTEANDLVAFRLILYYWSQESLWNNHIKSDGLSVRCLKDN
jgi:uncharacterized protein (TIGR02145 family)